VLGQAARAVRTLRVWLTSRLRSFSGLIALMLASTDPAPTEAGWALEVKSSSCATTAPHVHALARGPVTAPTSSPSWPAAAAAASWCRGGARRCRLDPLRRSELLAQLAERPRVRDAIVGAFVVR